MNDTRRIKILLQVKMSVHDFSVHASISPACTHEFYSFSKNCTERFGQRFLNRSGIGLRLPAVVMRSVVSELDEISQRSVLFSSAQSYKVIANLGGKPSAKKMSNFVWRFENVYRNIAI